MCLFRGAGIVLCDFDIDVYLALSDDGITTMANQRRCRLRRKISYEFPKYSRIYVGRVPQSAQYMRVKVEIRILNLRGCSNDAIDVFWVYRNVLCLHTT